jgi:hypothetical protein
MVVLWKSLWRDNVFFTWQKCSEWIHSHRVHPFQRNEFRPLFRELKQVMAINIHCKNWRKVFDSSSHCFKARAMLCVKNHSEKVLNTCSELKVSTVRLLFKIKLNYGGNYILLNSWGYGIKLLWQLPCWAKGLILHCVIWPTFRISVWKFMDFNDSILCYSVS